ncbi:DUF2076 domain-containing protein [Xylophilus sp.]|uniref:DUF2076 domain-containing protein n=1 Tax=Xylophilus sp. TaxID=2653893 RepID=UPI0013BAC3F5|nr:DUF2076 family protein [Xylophilus sp.]KAF1045213.1 MAG: hypothetical protein GAK38_03174 [Xylophilus sp.]
MTPTERSLLDDLLQRLAQAGPLAQKDAEADARIRQQLAGQPDALYLLAQRCLLLEHGLEQAQQEIARLQQERQQPAAGGGSFLGGAAERAAPPEPGFGRAPSQAYTPSPAQAAPAYGPPPAAPGWRERWFGGGSPAAAAPSAGGSFLGTAASAAAGVAGGMFLFQGLEHLLGRHDGAAGLGGFGNASGLLGPGMVPQETVVQNITNENFYDSDGDRGRDDALRSADWTPDDDGPAFGDDDGESFI